LGKAETQSDRHPITLHSVLVTQATRHRDVTPPAPVQNERYRTPAILAFSLRVATNARCYMSRY